MKYLSFLFLCFCANFSFAQKQLKPLQIGDTVPDINIDEIINFKQSTATLHGFKGKLLILDFWATWCSPCVTMIPKTDSLQKLFGDKIEILPVAFQNRKTVEDFLIFYEKTRHITEPSVVGDTILRQLFRYSSLPTYFWIDQNSQLIAITEFNAVNRENIQQILDGKIPNFHQKEYRDSRMDGLKRAFGESYIVESRKDTSKHIEVKLPESRIWFQSLFTKAIKGLSNGYGHWDQHSFTAVDFTPSLLLRTYYGVKPGNNGLMTITEKNFDIQVRDSALLYKLNGGWLNKVPYSEKLWQDYQDQESVCYQISTNDSVSTKKMYEIMEDDLHKYFKLVYNLDFYLEKKRVSCLLLKALDEKRPIQPFLESKGKDSKSEFGYYSYNLINVPFKIFLTHLKDDYGKAGHILVDSISYKGNIDLKLNQNIVKYQDLNKDLAKYNLVIVPSETLEDVLVVKQL